MKKILLFLSLLVLATVLYFSKDKVTTQYEFYHWKQSYKVSSKVEPKYIKVLDIAYENKTKIHITKFIENPKNKIVPVIYIDNPVFKHEKAKKFAQKLFYILNQQAQKSFTYDEVQIDCDWTDNTKEAYFSFLTEFKNLSKKPLSSTIRLHQVKYHQRTSVPPVDKGILMYYNMANFKDLETKNYILDLELAKKYHYNFDTYPLPLDLALPLYAQATIIRFESIVGIIEGIRKKELTKDFKALKENHYEVLTTHYFKKRLLYKGDILRMDEVSPKMLKQAVKNLSEVMEQPKKIIFYRWGNKKEYKLEDLHLFN
ncbi:MAG TPA: hypothetical protein EYG94_05705 [Campylobacterales bacterium]|nr:hypothetical protein [Campylobacterales bacterium]